MTLSQHIRHQFLPSKNAPNGSLWVDLNSAGKPLCNPTYSKSALSCSPNPNNPNPNYDPKATHT